MSVIGLLGAIAPLVLLGAISPIMFLNGSAVATSGGLREAVRFLAGGAVVLVLLGAPSVGFLGAAAAGLAVDQRPSRAVDAVLALVMLGFGLALLRGHRRAALAPEETPVLTGRGTFGWGVFGMATNFTTLPLFVAACQRVGASGQPFVVQVLVLAGVIVVTLAPMLLPMALLRWAPQRLSFGPGARATVGRWTRRASITACFVGAGILALHAITG